LDVMEGALLVPDDSEETPLVEEDDESSLQEG
jgi:hypothetical protein